MKTEEDGLKYALKISKEYLNTLLYELKDFSAILPYSNGPLLVHASVPGMTPQELTEKLFNEAKIAITPMIGWGIQTAILFPHLYIVV